MAKGMMVTGIAAIVIGVLAYFVVRNTPQELGIYPDNVSKLRLPTPIRCVEP